MFSYKIDVLKALSERGYTSTRMKRKDHEWSNHAKSKKGKGNYNRHVEHDLYYIKMSAVWRSGNCSDRWRKNKILLSTKISVDKCKEWCYYNYRSKR